MYLLFYFFYEDNMFTSPTVICWILILRVDVGRLGCHMHSIFSLHLSLVLHRVLKREELFRAPLALESPIDSVR